MGYLDRAKAFLIETGSETGTGIDCAKSVISAKSQPEGNPLPEGYRLKYPEAQASQQELQEIVDGLHTEGYVLLWDAVLHDLIAFYRGEEARSRIPPGIVPYSEDELRELHGDAKPPPSRHTMRLVHEAKKRGCTVRSAGQGRGQ